MAWTCPTEGDDKAALGGVRMAVCRGGGVARNSLVAIGAAVAK